MRIRRHFTVEGHSPYEGIAFRLTRSEIRNPDGSVVFVQDGIEVPESWSQVAADVLAQKYFRKAGVPKGLRPAPEEGVPEFLWRKEADPRSGRETTGEHSAKQVFDRLAGTWTYWGWKGGYFDGETDARAFYDELRYMLAAQKGAPNSPQWFNTGLHWAYGIEGSSQGHYYVDQSYGRVRGSPSAFEHPQAHSCFIQSIEDDLVGESGILSLLLDEARIAKFGSGTGANFSKIRGSAEGLSGGGKACGLVSVLRTGDRAASLVTAKGSTRRASKMIVVDIDHPDIEEYIDWKVEEEHKVAALVTGSKTIASHVGAILRACMDHDSASDSCFQAGKISPLNREIRMARKAMIPESYVRRAIDFARQGAGDMD